MTPRKNPRRFPTALAACLAVGLALTAAGDALGQSTPTGQPRRVRLSAPMFACLARTDAPRAPEPATEKDKNKDAETAAKAGREDEIFFILAGKDGEGRPVVERQPRAEHLMLADTGLNRIYKNVTLWEGTLRDGEQATLVVSVRERDGGDSAGADLKEAAEIAGAVDNGKPVEAAARIHAGHILGGGDSGGGENDHVGSVVVRLRCDKGVVTLQALADENAHDLKGHAKDHPTRRAFSLDGHQGDFRLILEASEVAPDPAPAG